MRIRAFVATDLCARESEARLLVVRVTKHAKSPADRLLMVGEDLAKREVRSDVHVGRGDETVFEVVHAFDVKTRAALIGIRLGGCWSKDAILHGVEAGVEIRTRVGARAQVAAEAKSALRVDVAAEREVGERPSVDSKRSTSERLRA